MELTRIKWGLSSRPRFDTWEEGEIPRPSWREPTGSGCRAVPAEKRRPTRSTQLEVRLTAMGEIFSMMGITREQMLEWAQRIAGMTTSFDLRDLVREGAESSPSRSALVFDRACAELIVSALELAPKLAMGVIALDMSLKQAHEEAAAQEAAEPRHRPADRAREDPPGEMEEVRAEATHLRELLKDLILNADPAWEAADTGHDWGKAMRAARAALTPADVN